MIGLPWNDIERPIKRKRIAPLNERFLSKAIPEPNSGCWLWTGSQCNPRYGYGSFSIDRKYQVAHRVAWMMFRGPIPYGMEIDHKCKSPHCVNVDHLRVVTKSENLAHRTKERSVCNRGHKLYGDNVSVVSGIRRFRICRMATRQRANAIRRQMRCEAAE